MLESLMYSKNYKMGEQIFHQGDAGGHMYAIVDGRVEIQKDGNHLAEMEGVLD